MKTNKSIAQEAKNIIIQENEATQLKPYCIEAEIVAQHKSEADALRPLAADELQQMLSRNDETRDFTGTVLYMCGGKVYKIRVQRPDITNWRNKRLDDPALTEYKALRRTIDQLTVNAKELEAELAAAHPRCINRSFVIAYLK